MTTVIFTEIDNSEVEINVENLQLAVFLQKLVPTVAEMYLRRRLLSSLSNTSHGRSHWLEHVFLPRTLRVYGDGSFDDDHFFNPRMLSQLEERVNKNFITQSISDTYVIGLIGRNFIFRFSKDKKSIIISFSETHKGVDTAIHEILKVALKEKM
ncbi:MAG: hypothetical protein WC791_03575 [Candidatus Paceibacterota bacterium]